jgi:hypothetical protein
MDQLDREEIEATLLSRGWRLIEARQRAMVEQKTRELRQDQAPEATQRVRGFLDGVERCLAVPEILKAECK